MADGNFDTLTVTGITRLGQTTASQLTVKDKDDKTRGGTDISLSCKNNISTIQADLWILGIKGIKTSPGPLVMQPKGGNVGIGTENPLADLIVGNAFGASISGGGGGGGLFGSNLATNDGVNLYTPYKHDSGYGYAGIHATWGSLKVFTSDGKTAEGQSVNPTPRLVIDSKGNVGVGTEHPKNKLQIEGNLHMNGNPIFLRQGPEDQFDVIKWNSTNDVVSIGGFHGVHLCYTKGEAQPKLTSVLAIDDSGIAVLGPLAEGGLHRLRVNRNTGEVILRDEHNKPTVTIQSSNNGNIGIGTTPQAPVDICADGLSGIRITNKQAKGNAWNIFHNSLKASDDYGLRFSQDGKGVSFYPGGNMWVDGDVNVRGDVCLAGADCAEHFDIAGSEVIEAGTVMVIDQDGALKPSKQAYDKRVAGVISGTEPFRPGIILDKKQYETDRLPLALVGKVYCKVDASYGPIEVGDMLTTSPTRGHGMKADKPLDAFGAVFGKALGSLDHGTGSIPILVALQ